MVALFGPLECPFPPILVVFSYPILPTFVCEFAQNAQLLINYRYGKRVSNTYR